MKTFLLFFAWIPRLIAAEISITIDDFHLKDGPHLALEKRDEAVLAALKKHQVEAALFVKCGYLENPAIHRRLGEWEKAGHLIGNHTYSHEYYHKTTFKKFATDFDKCHEMIKDRKTFVPLFRFPFLKGGDTKEKRDLMQAHLKKHGYKNGYVSVDASDWYISELLEKKIKAQPKANLKPYREYYLDHMWKRSLYYEGLAQSLELKNFKHTILIHHNLLNSLFLDDLIQMYKDKGWKIVSASAAFKAPEYGLVPNVVPFGESITWTLAKERGVGNLRYPPEDARFEKEETKKLGL